jgi:hypothetical protein
VGPIIYIYRVGDDANAYDFIDLIWVGVGGEPKEENVVRFIGFKRWVYSLVGPNKNYELSVF